jgi:hypothetical protein
VTKAEEAKKELYDDMAKNDAAAAEAMQKAEGDKLKAVEIERKNKEQELQNALRAAAERRFFLICFETRIYEYLSLQAGAIFFAWRIGTSFLKGAAKPNPFRFFESVRLSRILSSGYLIELVRIAKFSYSVVFFQ